MGEGRGGGRPAASRDLELHKLLRLFLFAMCLPIARDGAVRSHCAGEAMVALRSAVAAAWSDAAHAARDPDLVPLHDRPEFRTLLAELSDHDFPVDPFARRIYTRGTIGLRSRAGEFPDGPKPNAALPRLMAAGVQKRA